MDEKAHERETDKGLMERDGGLAKEKKRQGLVVGTVSRGCPYSLLPALLRWTSLFSLFKEEPRKVCFTYDLFLNLEGNPPVNHLRCEKLTFNNPTIEFRYKLLMAGGVSAPLLRWTPGYAGCWVMAPAWLLMSSSLGAAGAAGSSRHVCPVLAGCQRLRGAACACGSRLHCRPPGAPSLCWGVVSCE